MSDGKKTMEDILIEQEKLTEQPPPPYRYWDIWRQKREKGIWINMLVTFTQFFMLCLFVRVCRQFAILDFHFAIGWQEFAVSAGMALLFWFGREYLFARYEARQKAEKAAAQKHSKEPPSLS